MQEYIGYHGTSAVSASKILETKRFKRSHKEDEWLGEGVYFFLDANDAKWWCDCRKIEPPHILRADVNAEIVVDLYNGYEDLKEFKKFCLTVKDKCSRTSSGKERSNHMSLAIKIMVKLRDPDVIIAAFDENRSFWVENISYKHREKFEKQFPLVIGQLQMCVRHDKCISNIAYHEAGV